MSRVYLKKAQLTPKSNASEIHETVKNILTEIEAGGDQKAKKNADQTCIGRNGEMEDLDGPLLFLCSEASSYVTGQVLMVDGGFTAK